MKKNKNKDGVEKGKTITMPQTIPDRMSKEIVSLFKTMFKDVKKQAISEEGASAHRIGLNKLLNKYQPLFNDMADKATGKMLDDVLKSSDASVRSTLKDFITLKTKDIPESMREIIKAASIESTSLIKLIPKEFISEVQVAVMNSIVGNSGLDVLVPFLTKKYKNNVKRARRTAMDQTRKVHSSLVEARCVSVGLELYTWRHTGGSKEPRKLHVAMDGKVYRFDDPPIIDEKTKQRGKPGDLIECHCRMQPLLVMPGATPPKIG